MGATLSGKPLTFTPTGISTFENPDEKSTDRFDPASLAEKAVGRRRNFVDEHALTAAISRVRNKIETPDRQYIKTVYGMGYMWIGGALK